MGHMNDISVPLIALGMIAILFPLIITSVYLAVRNKRITQELLFLTAGTFCCFGVNFFATFIIGQIIRCFIDPQKPPTSFTPFTISFSCIHLLPFWVLCWAHRLIADSSD